MNEYQKFFLLWVFIYYLLKIGIIVACYFVATLIKEKAQKRHEEYKVFYMKKRADERERWKVAYGIYDRQKNASEPELLVS